MSPNVAIVITNYNYGEYLIQAINSGLKQDYNGNIRVYVVDDGSMDDSWDKLCNITNPHDSYNMNEPYYTGLIEERRDGKNLYCFRITNSGASTGRNVAIWQAWEWADIFGILDSDDEYLTNKVSVLVDKLMEHDEVGVAYADYETINPFYTKDEFKESYNRNRLLGKCIVHSGSLIKKEYLEKIVLPNKEIFDSRLHGPASKEFIGCTEDYDLWLRLSKICMIVHVPEKLSIVNQTHDNQSKKMTQDIFKKNSEILASRI